MLSGTLSWKVILELTGDGGDVAHAVFTPPAAEGHIVHFSMMAAQAATKGKDFFRR